MPEVKSELRKLDHPIVFLLVITLGVVGMMAVLSWGFTALGWSGPLAVVKGGFISHNGGANQ